MPTATAETGESRALLARIAELERENALLRSTTQSTLIALQASEGRLKSILESATDYAIITQDPEGRITGWSPGARAVFGWEESEVLGQDGGLIFTPEDRAAGVPREEAANARAQGRAEDERWHLRKDGSVLFANGALMPLRDGADGGFIKILRDRTAHERADEALRDNEARQRDILESISDAFYALDRDMRFVYVNRRAAAIWNRRAEDILGHA